MISKRITPSNQNCDDIKYAQVDRYYSVEFTLDEVVPLYQFKLRNSEAMSLFVLIKDNSEILNRIEVGRVLKMKYYNADISCPPEYRTTQISNIKSDHNGRFSGHCMVGLSILPTNHNHQSKFY